MLRIGQALTRHGVRPTYLTKACVEAQPAQAHFYYNETRETQGQPQAAERQSVYIRRRGLPRATIIS